MSGLISLAMYMAAGAVIAHFVSPLVLDSFPLNLMRGNFVEQRAALFLRIL